MPPHTRRQPVSIVRARPTDEPDALLPQAPTQAPAAEPETAPPAKRITRRAAAAAEVTPPDPTGDETASGDATAQTQPPTRPTRTRSGSRGTAAPAAPQAAPISSAAEPAPDTARKPVPSVQRSFLLRTDIVEDLRAAVTYVAAYRADSGIKSNPDVVNPALAGAVKELQDAHNNGKPFPRVARMAGGRPPGRPAGSSKTEPVSFLIRVDILEDLRAAVFYLSAYKPAAGIVTAADVINPALARAIVELQNTYNHGRRFRRVARMPTGRPARNARSA